MRAPRLPALAGPIFGVLAVLLAMVDASAQTTYPDCYIQNVDWTSGDHFVVVPQAIYSPGDGGAPASSTGAANTEFVSATQIRLMPGFHAGDLTGDGRFRARINPWMGDPEDLVVISPDASQIEDDVLHVNKWEKLEIGYKLPQVYEDAIQYFFDHYYPFSSSQNYTAVPGNVDPGHDLNPYADDSLQLVMTLIDPSGDARLKWGFYMKEADWTSGNDGAALDDDQSDPLDAFRARFRFAPDEEGTWQFSLSIAAPHTTTLANAPLAPVWYAGYGFVCDPPLPDNKGPLAVNPNNHRNLWFAETQEPFFGLGVNMAAERSDHWTPSGGHWSGFYKRDFETMKTTMQQLHEVGGNFMRMYLLRQIFAPEWVNLGVYDRYRTPPVCTEAEINDPNCPDYFGWNTAYSYSCQFQCWAFDRMLEHARDQNIYLQLCIDPYMPGVGYEKDLWGAHPYVIHFLEPEREVPPDPNPYDLNRFFYEDGDPDNHDDRTVFYYWKRKYKYIMSRWGYSVNIPIIEPFNEIDQMLSYGSGEHQNLTSTPASTCADLDDVDHIDICRENRVQWYQDTDLPITINNWVTDIAEYVRGTPDFNNPVTSPLHEDKKLFLMSYAGGDPDWTTYHLPFTNDSVDLIDAHRAPDNAWDLRAYVEDGEEYRNNSEFQTDGKKKPFHHGEWTSYGNYHFPDEPPYLFEYGGSYRVFDNYDVSFHNELWATTFGGSFGAGTSWGWERVFWWPDALPHDHDSGLLDDDQNPDYPFHSGAPDAINHLYMGMIGNDFVYADVKNATLHHHFKPLSDFLSKPSVQALGLFSSEFTPHVLEANGIECFYLQSADDIAVGWVHNTHAYWKKAMYITAQYQHYMDCTDPAAQWIDLTGFQVRPNYYVSYFPTRMDATDAPADYDDDDGNGSVHLRFNNPLGAALNGTYSLSLTETRRNHLDTLHSDYAFIISPSGFVKSLHAAFDTIALGSDWDFAMYPNPAHDEVFLRLPGDTPKDIAIHDLAGRQISFLGSVTDGIQRLCVEQLAKGVYWIRVSDGERTRTKKLLVH